MALVADDGTILKPKEGIVLDENGQPLTHPHHEFRQAFSGFAANVNGRSFRLPIPAIVGAVLFVPIALALGAAFVSVIAVLLGIFFILSAISRVFR